MSAAFLDKADSINQLDVVPQKMQRTRFAQSATKRKLITTIALPPATDLFGQETPTKRTNAAPEAAALCEVLRALRAHPAVSWCERMNSGAAKVGGRFIRFGWPGCPDVLGQLKDGRLLGVEVKAQTGRLRPEQALFLDRIRTAGGVAFIARDLRDVVRELGPMHGRHPAGP